MAHDDAPERMRMPEVDDLRCLLELSQDLICLAGIDGYLRWVNPRWSALLGWSAEELCRRPFVEFVHPADIEATFAEIGRLSEGLKAVCFVNRYRCADGSWRWLSWNTTPRDDGTLFCIARDVTAERVEHREQEARIRQLELAEGLAQIGTWRVDLRHNTVHWSPAVYRIHGQDPETHRPDLESAIEAYHPDDRAEVQRCLDEALAKREGFRFRLRLIRADDGSERMVLSSGVVQLDDEGEPFGIIGVFQDITELLRAEGELRAANAALERRMVELELRSDMMEWISQLGDMLQSSLDIEESHEVLGVLLPRIFRGLSGVVYLRDENRPEQVPVARWGALQGPWQSADPSSCWAVRRGSAHAVGVDGQLRCRHLAGLPSCSRCVPLMAHGQLVGLLVLASSPAQAGALEMLGGLAAMVAEQIALAVSNIRLRERLRQQSLRDQLTGLYNRRFFDDWLTKQISLVQRQSGQLGVAILDLDHFKRFNDTHGHLVADQVLVRFSALLQDSVRAEDVVCRWGGEEFLIAFPGTSMAQVCGVLERILAALIRLEIHDGEGNRISMPTFSAGLACLPDHATHQEQLIRLADLALYKAKNSGRNCIVVSEREGRVLESRVA